MAVPVAQFQNTRTWPECHPRHFNLELFVLPFGIHIGQARATRIDIANFHIFGHITPT
jgi:hypothetical protein